MTVSPQQNAVEEQKDQPTLGRLVADASREVSTLVRSEIALAKTELKVSVKAGGIGAALLLVAAFLGVMALIMGSFTVAYFIVLAGLNAAWAFLIVTGAYLLVLALLALVGIRKLKQIKAPEKTIETAKSIPAAFKKS